MLEQCVLLLKQKRKYVLFMSHFNESSDFQNLIKSNQDMRQVVIAFKTLYKDLFHFLFFKK